MSKLLHRAHTKLALAQYSIERINEDDAFLDSACFEIQQSIEFALKYWIELSGLGVFTYPRHSKFNSSVSCSR